MNLKTIPFFILYFLFISHGISQSNLETSHYYDESGRTTLINAILAKDSTAVKNLVADEFLVNLPEKEGLQGTPLMFAATMGQYETCKLLIKNGADINQLDVNRDHALNWAAFSGQVSTMELLLSNGADATLKSKHGTALDVSLRLWHHDSVARVFRHTKIAKSIQSKERKFVNAILTGNDIISKEILKNGFSPNTMDELDIPVLQLASQNGNYELARNLISSGGNPNILNRVGQTPLSWAARFGHEDVVDLLLQSGADPNRSGTDFALTPLIGAAVGGNSNIGQLLIDHGALPNHKDKINNAAAVHWALLYDNQDFVRLLVENGIDPYEKALDDNQYSAYDMAKNYKKKALISYLDSIDLSRRKQNIRGSWKVVEVQYMYTDTTYIVNDIDYGRFLFSDENYALMYNPYMQKRSPFINLSKPEDTEVISAFKTIVFNSGSYTIERDVIKTIADIAKVPGFEGGQQYFRIKALGKELELTLVDETYPDGGKPQWFGKLEVNFLLKKE